ncbi:MAG: hydroxymethylglutaryl-CoA synthase [Thermoplasmatota archaeon]
MGSGIVSYGIYVPRYRIYPKDIGRIWGQNGEAMGRALNIKAKSVPAPDEDAATIAVMAARRALKRVQLDPSSIGAIFVGSESHPYAVKPTASIVAEAVGAAPYLTAADLEFACKAGTAGMQAALGLINSSNSNIPMDYAMAIGSDTSQGAPGNALEYSASAGGVSYLLGHTKVIAEILLTMSYTSDTPDFWRREGMKYPSHGERFTGKPAYFKHIQECTRMMMDTMGCEPKDYDYAVFHQPNGKFPISVGRKLGFNMDQIKDGLMTPLIGNTYSGSMMIGLANILDRAKPGDKILAVSYGSGAGSDGFHIEITNEIEDYSRDSSPLVMDEISKEIPLDYGMYVKFREKIKMEGE